MFRKRKPSCKVGSTSIEEEGEFDLEGWAIAIGSESEFVQISTSLIPSSRSIWMWIVSYPTEKSTPQTIKSETVLQNHMKNVIITLKRTY